jgi:hypothetical protein
MIALSVKTYSLQAMGQESGMDPINKGLILGGATAIVVLAATFVLGGLLEQRAMDVVDETYSPARETTVDQWGWPSVERPPVRDGATEPGSRTNGPG